ncbi:SBBP repeat-containing protein [Phormidium tenue FACHB-886]|nr:SBBP repeat-containing protein [Phormidium tenue FACHB-886]
MERDRVGGSLVQAKNLGTLGSKPSVFRDFVGKSDLSDLYRVQIGSRSRFKLNLDGLGKAAGVGVEIFKLKGSAQKVVKALGQTDLSQLKAKDLAKLTYVARSVTGKGSYSLNRVLSAGGYYVRLLPRQGSTAYRISVSASPLSANSGNTGGTLPPATIFPAPVRLQLTQSWIKQFGTASNDYAYGVSIAGDNLYLSGSTEGSLAGANKGSRDSFAALYKTNGIAQWVRQFGAAGLDIATGIATDATGNYFVGGVNASTGILPDSSGYVKKYDRDGTEAWQQDLKGAISAEAIAALKTDAAGNSYAAGFSKGIPGFSAAQAYVAKYDTTGKLVWSDQSTPARSSSATSMVIDASGDVYIAGITNATLTTDTNNPFTGGDVFFAKYSNAGRKLWDKTIASAGAEYARGIAVDAAGNIYLTGQTDGTLPGQASAGGVDSFVAKYDTNGNQQWLKQFGTAALDEGQGIAFSNNMVYLTGETRGGIFDNAPLGGGDAWIAAFDSDGRLAGSTQIGTNQDDEAYNIAADAAGDIYLVGQTQGAFAGVSQQGNYDVWVAKYGVARGVKDNQTR